MVQNAQSGMPISSQPATATGCPKCGCRQGEFLMTYPSATFLGREVPARRRRKCRHCRTEYLTAVGAVEPVQEQQQPANGVAVEAGGLVGQKAKGEKAEQQRSKPKSNKGKTKGKREGEQRRIVPPKNPYL